MTAPAPEGLIGNALLAVLRDEDRLRLAPHMMIVDLEAKDVLQKAADRNGGSTGQRASRTVASCR